MSAALLVALVYCALIAFDYKRMVLLLVPAGLIMAMFPVFPGQSFSISDVCTCFAVMLLPLQFPDKVKKIADYPFYAGFIAVGISLLVTNLMAEPHWPSSFVMFASIYLFPVCVWNAIETEKDLDFAFKTLTAFAVIHLLYLGVELALQSNPILESLSNMDGVSKSVWNYTEVRFGMKRMQSIFFTPMSMGVASISLAFLFYYQRKVQNKVTILNSMLIVGCFIAPWLTGARSVFVAVLVMFLPVLIKTFLSPKYFAFKLAVISLLLVVLGAWLFTVIDSFIHSDTAVEGSSLEMRLGQLAVAFIFFWQSPVYGHGLGYVWSFVSAVDHDIYGAESVWLQLLIDYGLLGVIAYLVCVFNIAKRLVVYNKEYVAFPLGFLAAYSLSTLLGLDLNFFYAIAIIMVKMHEFESEKEDGVDL